MIILQINLEKKNKNFKLNFFQLVVQKNSYKKNKITNNNNIIKKTIKYNVVYKDSMDFLKNIKSDNSNKKPNDKISKKSLNIIILNKL